MGLYSSKINDAHVHIGQLSTINSRIDTADVSDFINNNRLDNILIMGTDQDPKLSNQKVLYLAENLDGVYGLHWYMNDINEVKLTNKMIGVKYHGAFMEKPVEYINNRVLKGLQEYGGILLVHCGRYKEGDRSSNTSYTHALAVASLYTDLKVILAHMGGTDTYVCKKAIDEGKYLENVYFDTSGITTPYIIEYAVKHLALHRILFGSDSPWCSFNSQLYNVLDANIAPEQKEYILTNSFRDLILETSKQLEVKL